MTVIKPRTESRCGYVSKFWEAEPSVQNNIKLINVQTQVNGTAIKTSKVENFDADSVALPSAYNPPKIRAIVTKTASGTSLISNVEFGGKRIQFICVDGNSLSQYEFENPHTVINKVNSGQLKPISFPDLNRLTRSDMTKIDAYAGSIWYCLFLWEVFGRVGIIDDSHVYLSVVNVNMANAFWNSHYMTYGNGQEPGAPRMDPLTAIDVVGHESGHGIIEALGNLTYQGESGALNESIADIFGTCLENYYDLRSKTSLFDWDLGEDFMVGGMRSLSNPKSHNQPDTYQGINWADPYGQFDNGGVHINSGVNNYFFYSLTEGTSGQNDNGTAYNVRQKFKIFENAKLIYNSLKGASGYQKITSNVNYRQYGDCIYANCPTHIKLLGLSPNFTVSVAEALVAIGLKQPEEVPEPQPETEPQPPLPEPESQPPLPEPESQPPLPEPEPQPPLPESEPQPPVPEPEPPLPPSTRKFVWITDFVSPGSPFYAYGLALRSYQGLLTYPGTQVIAAFNLSTLTSPQLHLSADLGTNHLVVNVEVDGKVYTTVHPPSGFGDTNVAIDISGFNLSYVKVSLSTQSSGWWPSWSVFKSAAFSSFV